MHEGALTRGGCMWSLMDLYAFRFLYIPYWLYCSLGGGSIWPLSRFNSQPCSCGILVLTNLPAVFLSH